MLIRIEMFEFVMMMMLLIGYSIFISGVYLFAKYA